MSKCILLIFTLCLLTSDSMGQSSSIEKAKFSPEQESIKKIDSGIFFTRMSPFSEGQDIKILKVPIMEEALADEFTCVDSDGQVYTKSEEISRIRSAPRYAGQKMKIEYIQIKLEGSMAVAKSLIVIEGEGGSKAGRYYVTNLYIKRADKWLQFSSQWTATKN